MNKKILVELTPKEAQVLNNALIKERHFWEDQTPEEASRTTKEDNISLCNSIWAKVDSADRPQEDQLISIQDLYFMISQAKAEYVRLPADLYISRKRVEMQDLTHISLAMSVIGWLNSKNLLKKIANFDITDHSYEYESSED